MNLVVIEDDMFEALRPVFEARGETVMTVSTFNARTALETPSEGLASTTATRYIEAEFNVPKESK